MPVTVKAIGASAAKWAARAAVAAQDYANGVANSTKDQAALAAAAEPQWAAGVQQAAANKLFSAGLNKAGTGAWKAGVASKGTARYTPGVQGATGKYTAKFGPYLSVISGLDLGPRYPRGDARNQQRSVIVQQALNKARVSGAA